jgi:D-serine deaminase-like pyridoxal phosphate-dependent protein
MPKKVPAETPKIEEAKFNKQEIIYSAIVEKELLHNGMVQRETLKTLKDLNATMSELTLVVKSVEQHQFFILHQKKWKVAVYNIAM